MKVSAFIHGIYPRSSDLVRVTRDLDRGRAKASDFKKQLNSDFNNLIKNQKDAKLDYLETGLLNWQDIFRPIVEASDGMEAQVVTRWFDNNSFFRQPHIKKSKLVLNEKKLKEFFPRVSSNWKVTLPSPFTFARLTTTQDNLSFEKVLGEITDLLIDTQDFLKKGGVSYIQYNEPYLVYHKTTENDIKLFNKSIKKLSEAKSVHDEAVQDESASGGLQKGRNGIKTGVQFYFGDVSRIINKLDLSAIGVLGIDFYKTSLATLPKKLPNEISAGVIEGRNSLIEENQNLIKFVESLINHTGVDSLYITNNSDLELLPETVAAKKIQVLGRVQAALLDKSAA